MISYKLTKEGQRLKQELKELEKGSSKIRVLPGIKKVAAVAVGALFVGATMGVAAVFG